MLDVGWSEILLIVAIAVLVIGPEDMPKVLYAFGRVLRRLQYVRFALSKQFEDFMQEGDLRDIHKQVNFEVRNDIDEAAAGDEEEGAGHEQREP